MTILTKISHRCFLLRANYLKNCRRALSTSFVNHGKYKEDSESKFTKERKLFASSGAGILSLWILYEYLNNRKQYLYAKSESKKVGEEIPELSNFSSDEVAKHNSKDKRIWVSYKDGVYDITDFVDKHPGGDKILIAAGGAVEPFWELYAVHKSTEILQMLEEFRIGNLKTEDRLAPVATCDDPYAKDPRRHPILKPSSVKPFNAEPPLNILVDNFFTPNDIFYVRNHLPVPHLNAKEYELEVEGFGLKKSRVLTLQELKTKFPKHSINATIMCAGNRRSEMNKVKMVKGLSWGAAAIGTAKWSGARLVDVLKYCELNFDDERIQHVQFEGADLDPTAMPYGASVTPDMALDPKNDYILAYEMNGVELPKDHGYPVRLIAPGIVGARNVKWLTKIVLSDEESHSHWQRKDYKGFSPSVDWDTVDFDKAPAIQETPVLSVICEPLDGEKVKVDENNCIKLRGYAWSGGGKKIIRVDVTADDGKNWTVANLTQDDTPLKRTWSWSIWEASVPVPTGSTGGSKVNIICKAVDSCYDVQPENFAPIWNLRGVLANAYYRATVIIS